jgi:hypothetical protein
VQLELPGSLGLADGRYLSRDEAGERVLVVETLGAALPSRRRRRKPREAEPGAAPAPLPLTRVTVVRAHEPFDSDEEAGSWLTETLADEDSTDAEVDEALSLLNRALHAHAIASADPLDHELRAGDAVTVRIGHGSGKEVASGRFTSAREIDVHGGSSRRRRRDEELRPQERVAAVLGGREHLDACETLILRGRADLDANRRPEAALQLRVGLEALLVELSGALSHPGHTEDMAMLESRRKEAGEAANAALRGDLTPEQERNVTELLELCERVLRRRRVLKS